MGLIVADKNFLKSAPEGFCKNIEAYTEGIVMPINKPYRWTSADVIRKIKFSACRHFGKKNLKVGHAGTLDPLATGLLLVCIGKATKLAETFQKHDKEYLAGISFGATTPSYDLEKDVDRFYPYEHITENEVKEAVKSFAGEQEQVAPLFSAKSVDGTRAYEMARSIYKKAADGDSGAALDSQAEALLSRQIIKIHEIEVVGFCPQGGLRPSFGDEDTRGRINVADTSHLNLPHADVRVVCSKGTYIRALARDLGEALGSGAHLNSLCRTKTGCFSLKDALSVAEAVECFSHLAD